MRRSRRGPKSRGCWTGGRGLEISQQAKRKGGERTDGKGHDRAVVEERDDEDHERREIELERKGHDRETEDNTDGDGAGVDRVVAHALEDDSGLADGVDDSGESGLDEDNVGGTASGVGGTLDGNTDVGTSEGGRVVGSVTSHGDEVAERLETLDNLVLVLGEDAGEPVGVEDHLVEGEVLATLGEATGLEDLGGVHLRFVRTSSSSGWRTYVVSKT